MTTISKVNMLSNQDAPKEVANYIKENFVPSDSSTDKTFNMICDVIENVAEVNMISPAESAKQWFELLERRRKQKADNTLENRQFCPDYDEGLLAMISDRYLTKEVGQILE